MKNKNNRRLVISLLMVAIVLSLAIAVILPVAALIAEVKRVNQMMGHAQEEVMAALETIPEIKYFEESEAGPQMSANVDGQCFDV